MKPKKENYIITELKEYIKEIFDTDIPLNWTEQTETNWTAEFTVNDTKYRCRFYPHNKKGIFESLKAYGFKFDRWEEDHDSGKGTWVMDLLNTSKNGIGVFAALGKALFLFIDTVEPCAIIFSGDTDRQRIYHTLGNKAAKQKSTNYGFDEFPSKNGDTIFVLFRRKSLSKEEREFIDNNLDSFLT